MSGRARKVVAVVAFVVYAAVLVYVILWNTRVPPYIGEASERAINLVPFAASGGRLEVVLNVVLFVPFGLFMGLLAYRRGAVARVLPFVLTSVGLEVVQFVFALGKSDITDVITNSLGGIIGVLVCVGFCKLLGQRRGLGVVFWVCVVITVVVIGLGCHFLLRVV